MFLESLPLILIKFENEKLSKLKNFHIIIQRIFKRYLYLISTNAIDRLIDQILVSVINKYLDY